MPTQSEQRLHPLSILFGLGNELRALLVPAVALLFVSRRGESDLQWQITAALTVAAGLTASVFRYLTFRIRYKENEMVIRSGLIFRNERHIPYARIQNIDATQNLFHRLFGVMQVHLQTAGGTGTADASFSVLPADALEDMRGRVFASRGAAHRADAVPRAAAAEWSSAIPSLAADEPMGRVLLRLKPRELLLSGFIENRGMVIIAAAVGLVLQLAPTDAFIERWVGAEFEGEGVVRGLVRDAFSGAGLPPSLLLSGAAGVLVLLVIARLVSTVWAVVRLYGFTVTRVGEDLRMEHGLFTRVTGTIPIRRVQSVNVYESKLHRAFGMARVSVSTAGGDSAQSPQDRSSAREPLAPIVRASMVPALLRELQPDADIDSLQWQPIHPRAFGRELRMNLVGTVVVSSLLYLLIGGWVFLYAVLDVGWKILRARRFVERTGWSLTNSLLVVRGGWLRRTMIIARVNRIQVVERHATLFDRRTGMARVAADTAGSLITIPYLADTTATELARALSTRAASTAFSW